jgi:hypothetical protein
MGHELAWDELPEPVLYDLFQDAAAVLTGLYLQRQRQAVDPGDAASWWAKVMALRDQVRAADPDDRVVLAEHVTRWRREAADLNTN